MWAVARFLAHMLWHTEIFTYKGYMSLKIDF